MPDTSAVLALPYIQPGQAQKHVTHNEALRVLDALAMLAVEDEAATPPAAPLPGARHIVSTGATGAWAGQDGALALWDGTAWGFFAPQAGWRAWRRDSGSLVVHDGSAWVPLQGLGDSVAQLGVNTAADATNRLAVSAPASLFSHDGAGHQVKVNKAAPADTASLLFQTGFSGRAEIGTTGSEDFALKVSADGAAWVTALSVAAVTGVPNLAAGATAGGAPVYTSATLLGPVSESGGLPTGAVIQRGSNAEGEYVRFADGTQICTAEAPVTINTAAGAIFFSGVVTKDFPMPFVTKPTASGSMANTINGWVNGRAGNATQWTFSAFSHAARSGDTVQLLAVGRWF